VGRYTIKDLEQLSGIKAHTLRVWEQRYGILEPKRTHTNIRYYDDSDLRLVLNISFLNRNGQKISHIARLSTEDMSKLVMRISESNLEYPTQVNALVIAMVDLNEERFEKVISTNTLQFGFESTMLNIVYPFLQQIGILWQTGSINPAHEHFITSLIRQKLIVAIDGQIPTQNPYAKKYVLFLPEGEMHEISLLFATYIIKSRHNKAIYLGQNLPIADLGLVHEMYQPDFLFTIITSNPAPPLLNPYLRELKRSCPTSKILLSGYQAIQAKDDIPTEFTVFSSVQEMVSFVDSQSVQPFAFGAQKSA
jgi:DNA-binding transcriptional MerR regulator